MTLSGGAFRERQGEEPRTGRQAEPSTKSRSSRSRASPRRCFMISSLGHHRRLEIGLAEPALTCRSSPTTRAKAHLAEAVDVEPGQIEPGRGRPSTAAAESRTT